jgi:uroporphyrinogen-III synthase
VALAESRQLDELARLLQREGAQTLACPLIGIHDAPDTEAVLSWLRQLLDSRFDLVILMTGEAVRRLLGFAERAGLRQEYIAALGRTKTLCRGPKPGQALKELGLTPALVAKSPTTEGVMTTLREEQLAGRTVGLTLYGEPNPTLEGFLSSAGATVRPVLSYVYAPDTEEEQVARLIKRLQEGAIDVFVLTSSPQVDRLYEVAQRRGLEEALQQGWQRTLVAAVGPVLAEHLRQKGAPVHICPEQGFVMKNLVRMIARHLAGM